jgi:hypothetical protein
MADPFGFDFDDLEESNNEDDFKSNDKYSKIER